MLLTACCSFQLYDDALPPDSGNFLFNWSDDDCSILNALAWFRPAREAAARAHRRIFDDVIAPIFQSELRQVGNVTFDEFMRLYSIVSSRAFGDSQDSTLIPVFDLLNGISCGAASCHLCQHSFPVSPTQQLSLQAIDTLSEVRCGQEILLEYAELLAPLPAQLRLPPTSPRVCHIQRHERNPRAQQQLFRRRHTVAPSNRRGGEAAHPRPPAAALGAACAVRAAELGE